jgi:hypothetical protein
MKGGGYATTLPTATPPASTTVAAHHLALVHAHLSRLSEYVSRHKPRLSDVRNVATLLDLVKRADELQGEVGVVTIDRFRDLMQALSRTVIRHVPSQAQREQIAADWQRLIAIPGELPAIDVPPATAPTPAAMVAAIETDEQIRRMATDAMVAIAMRDAEYRRDVLMRLAAHETATADMVAIVTGRPFADDDVDLEISPTGEIVNHRADERVESGR